MVPVRKVELLRGGDVVELPILGGRLEFKHILSEMAVKFHEETDRCDIVRGNMASQVAIVFVSERRVVGPSEPVADAVDVDQNLELISVIKLVEHLSKSRNGEEGLVDTQIDDVD
jgi:hypothetical protein